MSAAAPSDSKTIVVGVDDTDASLDALRHSTKVASAFDADIVAVFVRRFPTLIGDEPAEAVDVLEGSLDESERIMKSHSEEVLKSSGVKWRIEVHDGDPGKALVDTAHDENASLVVVGASLHGAVSSLILSSVASYLLHHCDVSFVVVRP